VVSASRGGVGVTLQTPGESSSACPARQACVSLAVRDCHRERDSPPEGLSFGFSNTGGGGCQPKKGRYSEIIPLMRMNQCRISAFQDLSDRPCQRCRAVRLLQTVRFKLRNSIFLVLHLCRISFSPAQQKCSKPCQQATGNYYRLPD
jgi:hypothetical protein